MSLSYHRRKKGLSPPFFLSVLCLSNGKRSSPVPLTCVICVPLCVFVHFGAIDVYDHLCVCMGPICEIRLAIAEIRGAQKEDPFWPDVAKGVTDSYND